MSGECLEIAKIDMTFFISTLLDRQEHTLVLHTESLQGRVMP